MRLHAFQIRANRLTDIVDCLVQSVTLRMTTPQRRTEGMESAIRFTV